MGLNETGAKLVGRASPLEIEEAHLLLFPGAGQGASWKGWLPQPLPTLGGRGRPQPPARDPCRQL